TRSQGRPGTPSTTPTPHRVSPGSTPSTRTPPPPVAHPYVCSPTLSAGPTRGHATPSTGTGAPPLVGHPPDELVAPPALEDLVVYEVRLAPHAQPLHEAGGRSVARVAASDDAVQSEVGEAEPEHHPCRLAGQATAVVRGIEHEADLTLPVLLAQPA